MLSAIKTIDIEFAVDYHISDGHIIVDNYDEITDYASEIRDTIDKHIANNYEAFIGDFKEQNSNSGH